MARTILITSGKGGTGKSTVCVNLGRALAKTGKRVCLVDLDFGLNSLDAMCFMDGKINFDLIDAVNNRCRIKQAIVSTTVNNLFLIACNHSFEDCDVRAQEIKLLLNSQSAFFDFFLIDSPSGIDSGFHKACAVADEALLVLNPYPVSVRDADKVISLLNAYEINDIFLLINGLKADLVQDGRCLSDDDVQMLLKYPVKGVIPDCEELLTGNFVEQSSWANRAFSVVANNLIENKNRIINYCKQRGFLGFKRRYKK